MAVRRVLKLGNPQLYELCAPVAPNEIPWLGAAIQDLHDTLTAFRARYGAGRAIAAPQIGVRKRIVYWWNPPAGFAVETRWHPAQLGVASSAFDPAGGFIVFLNPALSEPSEDMMEVWDDCMRFPGLLVGVQRHRACRIAYHDMGWTERSVLLEGDLSELLQHELDHLDGVLAAGCSPCPTGSCRCSSNNWTTCAARWSSCHACCAVG